MLAAGHTQGTNFFVRTHHYRACKNESVLLNASLAVPCVQGGRVRGRERERGEERGSGRTLHRFLAILKTNRVTPIQALLCYRRWQERQALTLSPFLSIPLCLPSTLSLPFSLPPSLSLTLCLSLSVSLFLSLSVSLSLSLSPSPSLSLSLTLSVSVCVLSLSLCVCLCLCLCR